MPHAILGNRAGAEGDNDQRRQHCRQLPASLREAHDQNRQQITETNRGQIQVAILHDVFEVKHAQVKHRQQRRDNQGQRRPQLAANLLSINPQSNRYGDNYRGGHEKSRVGGAGHERRTVNQAQIKRRDQVLKITDEDERHGHPDRRVRHLGHERMFPAQTAEHRETQREIRAGDDGIGNHLRNDFAKASAEVLGALPHGRASDTA